MPFMRHGVALLAVLLAAGSQQLGAQDAPVDLGQGDLDESEYPLKLTGFGVINYSYNARTDENSFAASKLAVALVREITDHAYLFGMLTTAVEKDETTGELATEVEIDNLILSISPAGLPNLTFEAGKLDQPLGFERDDEPLLFFASPSFNFELARPAKLVGVMATWSFSPRLRVSGLAFNGWDSEIDDNTGKTGGLRLEFQPGDRVVLGGNLLYGSEGETGSTNNRLLANVDYAFQPAWNWILAGEANFARDKDVPGVGDQEWKGGMVSLVHLLSPHWGVALRAEGFDDSDGARTGQAQTLTSYTIAALYSLGIGRQGIFSNVTRTRFRIPRLQLRTEVRFNHSDQPFFETDSGVSRSGVELRLQAVTTF